MAKELPQNMTGEQSWSQEGRIAKLPNRLSEWIGNEVRQFVEKPENQSLKAHLQYHDADVWYILQASSLENGRILQTRVFLVAYEGEKSFRPDLVFMPDKMLTDSDGQRFIAPPNVRREQHIVLSTDGYNPENPEKFLSSVRENLAQAWESAQVFPQEQATELLPEYSSSQSLA